MSDELKACAWQRRRIYPLASDPPGKVYQWEICRAAEATGYFDKTPGYEYRPLYTTPDPSAEVIAQFQAERGEWKIERSVGQIQIETLFEVIAGLVAALKPFAEAAAHLGPIHIYPEGATTMDGFTPMEFICAAQTLARAKELRT